MRRLATRRVLKRQLSVPQKSNRAKKLRKAHVGQLPSTADAPQGAEQDHSHVSTNLEQYAYKVIATIRGT